MMTKEEIERSLSALAKQQGHPGLLAVHDVVMMLELRDDRISVLHELLQEFIPGRRG